MPNLKSQFTVRLEKLPQMIFWTIVASVPLSFAIAWSVHPIKVWLNDGVWCAHFYADGKRELAYGSACFPREGDSQI
jgi:hypothetical protein